MTVATFEYKVQVTKEKTSKLLSNRESFTNTSGYYQSLYRHASMQGRADIYVGNGSRIEQGASTTMSIEHPNDSQDCKIATKMTPTKLF
jgi:hypothetical protein